MILMLLNTWYVVIYYLIQRNINIYFVKQKFELVLNVIQKEYLKLLLHLVFFLISFYSNMKYFFTIHKLIINVWDYLVTSWLIL